MTLISGAKMKCLLCIMLLLAVPVGAFDSTGCTTAEQCIGGWGMTTPAQHVGAWVTPDVSGLQVDSGLVGFGDDYDDFDSALIFIYDNSSKTPVNLLAVSDTAIVSTHHDCAIHSVMFNQDAIPQNDSIWIGIYLFGLTDRGDIGLSGSVGADVYYNLNNASIDDPWDTGADTYDGNWYKPTVRIYLSTAVAAAGQVIIIGWVDEEEE